MAKTLNSPRIFGVVLAAGTSRRFGRAKQLESFKGETLVARAVRIAREACGEDVALVVGHAATEVVAAASPLAPEVVTNDRFRDGMGTSLAAAAMQLGTRAEALLLLLADQPHVTGEHLKCIRDAWSGAPNEILATSYQDTAGPPVLLPAGTFRDLSKLTGDTGARHLFGDARFTLRTIRFEKAGIDIDTPGDIAGADQAG